MKDSGKPEKYISLVKINSESHLYTDNNEPICNVMSNLYSTFSAVPKSTEQ